MNSLEHYITRETNDKFQVWSINTTLAKIIGEEKSAELQQEISNWDSYKSFWDKYGLIIDRPSRFINIYILISLKLHGRLFCLPDTQPGVNLDLSKFNNQILSYWIYERALTYNPHFNFEIRDEGFRNWIYSPAVEVNNFMQLTHLIHSGFGDESCLENYYIVRNDKVQNLIEILNSEEKPELNDLLSHIEFLCMDYKGEDQGYGTLFEIYCIKRNSHIIEDIVAKFDIFKSRVDEALISATNLKELEQKMLSIMKEYGC